MHFSDQEELLDLLHLELKRTFAKRVNEDSLHLLDDQIYVLDCLQLYALKLARKLTSKVPVAFAIDADIDCMKSKFASQVIRSAELVFDQKDIAPQISVFGLLLDPIVLQIVGPFLSSECANDVVNQIFRIATRKQSIDTNRGSSQHPAMILALKLLRHLVQHQFLRIDTHSEDARAILRLVSYK